MSTSTSNAKGSWWALTGALGALYDRRWLAWYFVQRELTRSYRRSFLGIAWLILGPLLMIALYTLVFSEIIGLRFRQIDSVSNYGLFLYCGLLPFLTFSDTLNDAASNIRRNASLVRRVVFPLEILPLASGLTAFIGQFFGFGALLVLVAILEHQLQWTLLLVPVIAVPQLLFVLGLSYLTSIAGAYLPDLKETLTALVRAIFFLTPILWPAEVVPERLRFLVTYNPLAFLVETYRNLVLDGVMPDTSGLMWFTLFSSLLMIAGFVLFVRVKKQFADFI